MQPEVLKLILYRAGRGKRRSDAGGFVLLLAFSSFAVLAIKPFVRSKDVLHGQGRLMLMKRSILPLAAVLDRRRDHGKGGGV